MGRSRRKAELIIHEKVTSANGLIREVVIWKVPKSIRYPQGFRYRLALVDPGFGRILLLFDNHWPKGHHVHRGRLEAQYHFRNLRSLIADFRIWGEQEERAYEG